MPLELVQRAVHRVQRQAKPGGQAGGGHALAQDRRGRGHPLRVGREPPEPDPDGRDDRRRREIHLIADNLSAHMTKAVQAWLAAHPRVHLHYTPTYSSWLNQVELWFAKIERDCIARGIFTSTADLRRKLMQYIRAHNKTCHPFVWRYTDPTRRIRVNAD